MLLMISGNVNGNLIFFINWNCVIFIFFLVFLMLLLIFWILSIVLFKIGNNI